MLTTVVRFYAYSRPHVEVFFNGESMEQIHQSLNDRCSTYVPIEILKGEVQNQALSYLTDLVEITQRDFGTVVNLKKFISSIKSVDPTDGNPETLQNLRIISLFNSLTRYNKKIVMDEYLEDSLWKTKQLARGRLYEVKCFLSLLGLKARLKIEEVENLQFKLLIKHKSK